jgi:exonuclease SbcD
MTRVIHTGDTHLGYQQYHEQVRRSDFLDAFRQVVEDAVTEEVDAVVHAGDLFHDRRPTLDDIMGALEILRTLDDAGIPFLAIVGNHEAKREAQWLDLYESLGLATRLGPEPVVIGNTAFYGLDFVPRSKREDLAYDYAAHDADFAALVSHGLFEPFPHGDWDAREVLAAADVRFDALLLGDDHDPQTKRVEEPHEAWLTYCGSTERASAAEREERGYNVVVFDEETGVDVRRRGLDTRDFAFVDVDLEPGEGVERVRERVGEHDPDEAVVIVSISGEGEPVAPAGVEEYAQERGALVARVTDHREVAAETAELEVSFADPDAAVQERIRDLGLSPAARDIDETIRASKVPDSNVDDRVEERVAELVEAGDLDRFEPAPADGQESDDAGGDIAGTEATVENAEDSPPDGNAADDLPSEPDEPASEPEDPATEPDEPTADSDEPTTDGDEPTAEAPTADSDESTTDGDESTAGTDESASEPDESTTDTEDSTGADPDAQASMEEYL